MKFELSEAERTNLIEYRLERCRETLSEVDYLMNGGFYNASISRLYYACYYAVVALLISCKLETQTHAGIKNQFSLHFVKTKRFDKDLAKVFFKLFDLRHNSDYEDYHYCDKATIENLRPSAGKFIAEIEALLKPT